MFSRAHFYNHQRRSDKHDTITSRCPRRSLASPHDARDASQCHTLDTGYTEYTVIQNLHMCIYCKPLPFQTVIQNIYSTSKRCVVVNYA